MRRSPQRFIILATAGYALGASAWILLSDQLIASMVPNPSPILSFGTAKGLAFVAVTTALLYLALRHLSLRYYRSRTERDRAGPLAAVMGVLVLSVVGAAWIAYEAASDALRRAEEERLRAIAALQAEGVGRWLSERQANARSVSRNPVIRSAVLQLVAGRRSEAPPLLAALEELRRAYGFSGLELRDAAGTTYLSVGDARLEPAALALATRQAAGGLAFVDLHQAPKGSRLGYVAPIAAEAGGSAVAFLIFTLAPDDYLFGYLQHWPLPSESGESLLLRRQPDGRLLVLSPLRHDPEAVLKRLLPPAAVPPPIRQPDANEVEDYRGVPVLAATRPVPGTPWLLTAKLDVSEAAAGAGLLALTTGSLVAAVLALLAALLGFVWQRRRLRAALETVRQAQALQAAEQRFRSTFEQAAVGILHMDAEGRLVRVNARICEILGYGREELEGRSFRDLRHPDDQQGEVSTLAQLASGELAVARTERRHLRKDGSVVWLACTTSAARDRPADPPYFIVVAEDATERRSQERRLREAAIVFASTQEGLVITDLDGTIRTANPAFTAITGYSEAEAVGRNMRLLSSGRQDRSFFQAMFRTLAETGYWQGEIWNRHRNGQVHPQWLAISAVRDDAGQMSKYVASLTDISGIKESERQIERLAHFDPLTGLPNRLLLVSRLEHTLLRLGDRPGVACAVLFLDLDRFKPVNDSLGHQAGDSLLQQVAQRLLAAVDVADTVARHGADEFVLLLEEPGSAEAAADQARRIIDALAQPFTVGGRDVYVGGSIGISLFPADGETPEALIQHADSALYQAKMAGGGTFRFYTAALTRRASDRLELEARLRRALMHDELLLHFQPLYRLSDGGLLGVESLVRWHDPERGLIAPGLFVPLAEETGLILPLGDWVLRAACRQLCLWLEQRLEVGTLSVNLSAHELNHPDLCRRIVGILEETGAPPGKIEIEITETALMSSGPLVERRLAELTELGLRLAIDDFGTGYSSLSYLKRFPVSTLKIDRSFIERLPDDRADAQLTMAVIGLGHGLGLQVVAEGVETEAQLSFLRSHGCDGAQGYLLGRPQPATLIEARLRSGGAP